MAVISIVVLFLRFKYDFHNFKDSILIAMPFVAAYASYGFIKMARQMKEVSQSDHPVLVLTSDFIEIEGQRIPISSIRNITTQAKVTFVYPDESKKFVRILPYMRGNEGMKIDEELTKLWQANKTK